MLTPCLDCTTPTDGRLCTGCARATLDRLTRMPQLYQALGAYLRPGGRSTAQYGSSRPAEAGLPVAEAPLVLRGPGGMVGILEDWHAALRADRDWSPPVIRSGIGARLIAAAHGLRANMPWIVQSWPQAGQCAREIRGLEKSVLRIVDPPAPEARPVELGTCPAIDTSGVICGAVLHYQPGEKLVTCTWCLCSYPPATWLGLAALIAHDAGERKFESSDAA
ncbi:hypothetical protein ACIBJC_15165 [Streptomyces sp. NPDC050509]|uniref:hypothetical protein n=1 Tax=Streptomyces sp. NPDC050509 TaxID=3365620 RepID=UPI00378D5775